MYSMKTENNGERCIYKVKVKNFENRMRRLSIRLKVDEVCCRKKVLQFCHIFLTFSLCEGELYMRQWLSHIWIISLPLSSFLVLRECYLYIGSFASVIYDCFFFFLAADLTIVTPMKRVTMATKTTRSKAGMAMAN